MNIYCSIDLLLLLTVGIDWEMSSSSQSPLYLPVFRSTVKFLVFFWTPRCCNSRTMRTINTTVKAMCSCRPHSLISAWIYRKRIPKYQKEQRLRETTRNEKTARSGRALKPTRHVSGQIRSGEDRDRESPTARRKCVSPCLWADLHRKLHFFVCIQAIKDVYQPENHRDWYLQLMMKIICPLLLWILHSVPENVPLQRVQAMLQTYFSKSFHSWKSSDFLGIERKLVWLCHIISSNRSLTVEKEQISQANVFFVRWVSRCS